MHEGDQVTLDPCLSLNHKLEEASHHVDPYLSYPLTFPTWDRDVEWFR
jgi:hypothetical protein